MVRRWQWGVHAVWLSHQLAKSRCAYCSTISSAWVTFVRVRRWELAKKPKKKPERGGHLGSGNPISITACQTQTYSADASGRIMISTTAKPVLKGFKFHDSQIWSLSPSRVSDTISGRYHQIWTEPRKIIGHRWTHNLQVVSWYSSTTSYTCDNLKSGKRKPKLLL